MAVIMKKRIQVDIAVHEVKCDALENKWMASQAEQVPSQDACHSRLLKCTYELRKTLRTADKL